VRAVRLWQVASSAVDALAPMHEHLDILQESHVAQSMLFNLINFRVLPQDGRHENWTSGVFRRCPVLDAAIAAGEVASLEGGRAELRGHAGLVRGRVAVEVGLHRVRAPARGEHHVQAQVRTGSCKEPA